MVDLEKLSDTQAEAGIIATLVYHPEYILNSECLKAGYFYHKENGCIFWAIDQLYKAGVTNIDSFNITNMLESNKAVKKTLENVNMPNMDEFIDYCSDVSRHTIAEYNLLVEKVLTLSFKRDLYKRLDSFQKSIMSEELDLSQMNDKVYSGLEDLTNKYILNSDLNMFGDKVGDLWKEICDRRNKDGTIGIPSKFKHISSYFSYEFGELVLISGRMKMGKSSFMLNEAMDKILKGIPTVYFDTEMNDLLFYVRVLANLTGIDQKRIKSGNLLPEEQKIIDDMNDWLKKQPFVHLFIPDMKTDELYQTCKILKYKMGLQFVIYDYFKSPESDSSKQYNDLGAKCDFLKNRIAGELNLAVLAGAQLNRNDEVADSDKLERYASVSVKWRRKTADEISDNGKDCGNYMLQITLNRLGEQMLEDEYIDFEFKGSVMRIDEAKKQHSEEERPI